MSALDELLDLFSKFTYLNDQSVTIEGINFFGSPITEEHGIKGFQISAKELETHWDIIPENTDVLMTHGPPFEILDLTKRKENAGCKYLRAAVERVKPRFHFFGHIHDGRGVEKVGETTYCNAACKIQLLNNELPYFVFDYEFERDLQ